MNKNKAIADIAKHHKLWVNYVKKYSITENQFKYAEDFVQNLYIQLIESKSFSDTKIYDSKKQINRKYVFKTLRWLLNDDGKKRKIKTCKIIGNITVVDPITISPKEREVIVLKVNGIKICNYYIDFKIIHSDNSVELIEVKGMRTSTFNLKWKLTNVLLNEIEPNAKLTLVL